MDDLDFKAPEQRTLDNLPDIIHQAEIHVIRLRDRKKEEEAALKISKDLLKRIKWRELGSNDKERDAAFTLLLAEDKDISDQEELINKIDFAIKTHESLVEKFIREFQREQLKLRRALVRHEIFGGVPVPDVSKH